MNKMQSSLRLQQANPATHLVRNRLANPSFDELDSTAGFPATLPSQWLREADLNRRPTGYGPVALPDCATPRQTI